MVFLIWNFCLTNMNSSCTKCFKNTSTASVRDNQSFSPLWHSNCSQDTCIVVNIYILYATHVNKSTFSEPGTSSIFQRPVSSFVQFTVTDLIPARWPLPSSTNSCNNATF
jgi:hypothetical protein